MTEGVILYLRYRHATVNHYSFGTPIYFAIYSSEAVRWMPLSWISRLFWALAGIGRRNGSELAWTLHIRAWALSLFLMFPFLILHGVFYMVVGFGFFMAPPACHDPRSHDHLGSHSYVGPMNIDGY